MASYKECLQSYRLIGLPKITHIPNQKMLELVEQKRAELGPNITNEQQLLLINAIRCNAVCEDNDTKEEIKRKYKIYFSEIRAYEAFDKLYKMPESPLLCSYHDYKTTKWREIVFRITPGPKSSGKFLIRPVIRLSYLHLDLKEKDWQIKTLLPNVIQSRRLFTQTESSERIPVTKEMIIYPTGFPIEYFDFLVKEPLILPVFNEDEYINKNVNHSILDAEVEVEVDEEVDKEVGAEDNVIYIGWEKIKDLQPQLNRQFEDFYLL